MLKRTLFTILILSFGLALSACGNQEDMRVKEQENIKDQLQGDQEIEEQEVISDEKVNESFDSAQDDTTLQEASEDELDISKWREYENEYFNLKFKYHNNWYFQRDNLNQGDYIAVYGFASSSEKLNEKDYAIQLFILNSDDNFTEDFSYSQEKEYENKKYILVSNNNEYQEILNLMFENLEFIN